VRGQGRGGLEESERASDQKKNQRKLLTRATLSKKKRLVERLVILKRGLMGSERDKSAYGNRGWVLLKGTRAWGEATFCDNSRNHLLL